jgi:hypothetical protein
MTLINMIILKKNNKTLPQLIFLKKLKSNSKPNFYMKKNKNILETINHKFNYNWQVHKFLN